MKKILILLLLVVTINSNAEVIARVAEVLSYDVGQGFSDDISVDIDIVVDTDKGTVIIYSKETQVYSIVKKLNDTYDNGYHVLVFGVIDKDSTKAKLTLYTSDYKKDMISLKYADLTYFYQLKEN